MKTLSRFLLSSFALLGLGATLSAQIPGLIYKPSTSLAGRTVMDPNADGYTSKTPAGFTTNDMTTSEIPFHAIPQKYIEPTADLSTGGSGGHTDLIEDQQGEHSFLYYDGDASSPTPNGNLLFRMIMSDSSAASKGYSFLFVTAADYADFGKYGPLNPGFSFEVVLETNFRVAIRRFTYATASHTGLAGDGQTSELVATLDIDQFQQRSISYVHSGGTTGYFYDWYVPVATLNTALARTDLPGVPVVFNGATQFKVATTTITRAQGGIVGSPLSDVGGTEDNNYVNITQALIDQINGGSGGGDLGDLGGGGGGFPPPLEYTKAPVIFGPEFAGDTVIGGTLAEASPATVYVYLNGAFQGTATVTNGAWTYTFGSPLAAGQTLTAYAIAGTKELSPVSNSVVVSPVGVPPTCPTPPTATGPDLAGAAPTITTLGTGATLTKVQNISASWTGLNTLITTTKSNNTQQVGVAIYAAGTTTLARIQRTAAIDGNFSPIHFSDVSTDPQFTARTGDTFALRIDTGQDGLENGVNYELVIFTTDTNLGSPTAISARSAPFSTGLATATTAPTFNGVTALYAGDTTIPVKNNDAATATIYVYVDGKVIANASVGAGVSTNITVPAIAQGDVYSLRAVATGKAMTVVASGITVSAVPAVPVISGSYFAGNTSVTGTSTLPDGTTIKVYRTTDLVTPIGTTTVASGAWTATVTALVSGSTIFATATPAEGPESCASATKTVSGPPAVASTPPVITGDYLAGDTVVTGYSTEAPGTVIKLYVNGVDTGLTALVDEFGNWTVTGAGPFTTGQVLTATATAPGETESAVSNSKTVLATRSNSVVLLDDIDRLAFDPNDYYTVASDSITFLVPTNPGIITVYVDGVAIGVYDATGAIPNSIIEITGSAIVSEARMQESVGGAFVSTISPTYITDELFKDAVITLTNTFPGLGESLPSNSKVVVGPEYYTIVPRFPGPYYAGDCIEVIVTAWDSMGNVFTDFTDSVALYSNEVTLQQPSTTEPFVNGQSTASTCITALYGADPVRIRAIDLTGVTGVSDEIAILNPETITITDFDPTPKYVGEDTFTATITGTGFVANSEVRIGGVVIPPEDVTFIDFDTLEVVIRDTYFDQIGEVGSQSVEVRNPLPAGTLSYVNNPAVVFEVLIPPSPTITDVVDDGGLYDDVGVRCGNQVVKITGTGFIQGVTELSFGVGAAITVNSITVTVPYDPLNPSATTELLADITVSCTAPLGLTSVTVTNPLAPVPSDTLAANPNGFFIDNTGFTKYVIVMPGENFEDGQPDPTSGSPTAQVAGVAFPIAIYATTDSNTLYTGFNGTVDLSALFGPISPTITGTFTNGVLSSINVTLTQANDAQKINCINSDGLQVGQSSPFDLNPGPINKYIVTVDDTSPQVGTDITVTAQLADVYGNPIETAGRTVIWSDVLAGGGTFASGTSVTDADGIATVTFTVSGTVDTDHQFRALDSVNPLVTGVSPVVTTELAPVTATMFRVVLEGQTYSISPAGVLTISGTADNQTLGVPFDVTKIIATDGSGNVANTYNGTKTITWGGAGGTPVYTTTVTFIDGVSVSTLTTLLTVPQTGIAFTVTDGSINGTSSTFNVLAGPPTQITFGGDLTEPAGDVSDAVVLQLVDSFGNSTNSASPFTFNLTSSATGTFYSDAAGTLPITSIIIPAGGLGNVTVYYRSTVASVQTLTATQSGSSPYAIGGDDHAITITAGAPAGISLTPELGRTTTAGVATAAYTVTVVDQYGNATNVSANTSVALTENSTGTVTFSTGTTLTVASGTSSSTFTYTDTLAGTHSITATISGTPADAGLTAADTDSAPVTVNAAAPSQFVVIDPVDNDFTAGSSSDPIVIRLLDPYGNTAAAPVGGYCFTISSDTPSAGGDWAFRDAADSADLVDGDLVTAGFQVCIAEGDTSFSLRYRDEKAELHVISAVEVSSTLTTLDGSASVTALPGVPDSIILTPDAGYTTGAGVASGTYTVTVVDQYGNPTNVTAATTVALTEDSAGTVTFTGTNVVGTTLTIPLGQSSATFTYTDTAAGSYTITTTVSGTPTDAGLTGDSDTAPVVVTGGPPTQFTLTGPSSTVVTVDSTAFTIQLLDASGNPATVTGDVTLTITTENPGTGTITSSTVTITGPDSSGTFVYKDIILENDVTLTATVTAAASHPALLVGPEIETADIDIIGGPATQVSVTGPTSTAVGVDSTDFTVTLLDANGYPATVVGSVTLAITGENGFVGDGLGGTGTFTSTPITITGPANTGTFKYRDSVTEMDVLLTATVTAAASDPGLLGPAKSGTAEIDIVIAAAPVASLSGSALSFGAGAYGETVNLGDAAGLYADALTVEVWIQRDAVGTPVTGTEVIAANGTDWILQLSSSGEFEFVTGGLTPSVLTVTAADLTAAGVALLDNAYHHVAVVYDNLTDTKKVYVDGVLVKSEAVTGSISDTSNLFRIAADADGTASDFWNGAINEVRVWSVVRDEGQINAADETILNGYEFGLEHYWRIDEGSGSLVNNEVASADLNLFGAPTWEDPNSFSKILSITGLDTEIQLGGYDGALGTVTAFITALPGSGKLYQRLPNGDKGDEITAAMLTAGTGPDADPGEVQITDSLGRVIYEAAEPANTVTDTKVDDPLDIVDRDGLTTFSYLVKSGGISSAVEDVTIDLEAASLLGGTAILLNPPGAPALLATTTQYVITPNLRAGFADNSLTIEAWFRADGPGILINELGSATIDKGWHTSLIEIVDADGVAGPALGADNDAFVRVRVWNLPEATSTTLTTGLTIGTIDYGDWTHAAVRYNHLARRLDGALNGVPSVGSFSGDRQAPWETIVVDDWNRGARGAIHYGIGSRDRQHMGSGDPAQASVNNSFQGAIDEIRIWNEAIPDARLGAKYTQFIEGDDAKLVALYRFDEATGTVVEDYKGGYDATVVGGAGRTRSIADLNLGEVVWGDQFTVEVPGYDNGNGSITAVITRMPLAGALYQVDAAGAKAGRIANVPATVNDSQRRVIFEPATGSRSDSFEYLTEGAGDDFGTRRMRFRILRSNQEPVIAATGIIGEDGAGTAATESTAKSITHADLVAALSATDGDFEALTFRVEKVFNGTLAGPTGSAAVPMVTTVAPGQTLTWTPPPYVSAERGSELAAFRVVATDGRDFSGEGSIKIQIDAVDNAPVVILPTTALRFAGAGYATTPNLRSVMRTDDFTIQVWFRAEAPGVLISERANAAGTGWSNSMLEVVNDSFGNPEVRFRVWGTGTASERILGSIEYGKWYHAAVSYDDANRVVFAYVRGDGVDQSVTLSGTRNAPWDNGFTAVHYGIGRADAQNLGSGSGFRGQIRDVRIWREALPADKIRTSFRDSITGNEPELAVWYRFNDGGSSTTVRDFGPFRRIDGTVITTTVFGPPPGFTAAGFAATLTASGTYEWIAGIPSVLIGEYVNVDIEGFDPDGDAIEGWVDSVPTAIGDLGSPVLFGELWHNEGGSTTFNAAIPLLSGALPHPLHGDPLWYVASASPNVTIPSGGSVEATFLVRVRERKVSGQLSAQAIKRVTVSAAASSGSTSREGQLVSAILTGKDANSLVTVRSTKTFSEVEAGGFGDVVPEEESQKLRFDFDIDRRASFVVEVSDDLETWYPVSEVTVTDSLSDPRKVDVAATVDAFGGQKFIRVRLVP